MKNCDCEKNCGGKFFKLIGLVTVLAGLAAVAYTVWKWVKAKREALAGQNNEDEEFDCIETHETYDFENEADENDDCGCDGCDCGCCGVEEEKPEKEN